MGRYRNVGEVMGTGDDSFFPSAVYRYLFAIAAVAAAFGLRILLDPLTGSGIPFVLFFAATLVTALFAGTGPGVFALAISIPLATSVFIVGAGRSVEQAVLQSLLYTVDGGIIIGLTALAHHRRRSLDAANVGLRRMSEEAARSAARTREVIELAPDAFFLADVDGRYVDVNQAACQLLGYEREELVGKTIVDLTTPEHAAWLDAIRAELLVPGASCRAEWMLKRNDGTLVPVEVSSNILYDGRWQAFARDITERKGAEDALRRAVAARDDVLRIVAHDLRNPLSVITMEAAVMERVGTRPESRDARPRRLIQRAAARMNQLIQDLLDVSLVEAGRLIVEPAQLSVADLVRDAMEVQGVLAAASELDLRVDLGDDVRHLWGDRERLLQVFENLIGNAIKCTKAGDRIVVGAALQDGEVAFSVADTGCGIAPDVLPHMFDRFWQATAQARRLGAGLGLPITKGIVEAHGGRIWAESEVGRGTTVFFTIPTAPAEHRRAPAA